MNSSLVHLPNSLQNTLSSVWALAPSFTIPQAEEVAIPDFEPTPLSDPIKKIYQLSNYVWNFLDPRPKLDAKMFAHIHADDFMANTDLEGSSIKTTTSFLTFYASNLPKNVQTAITDITNNIHFIPLFRTSESYGSKIALQVKNLEENKNLWLQGGWTSGGGAPGHAMLYEFVKRANDTYDILIYNTGDGIGYHPNAIATSISSDADTPRLNILYPVVTFKGLKAKHLGIASEPTDPVFFVKLIQMQKTKFGEEASAEKIYEEIFGPFNSYREANPQVSNPYFFSMLPQASGTCSFKSVDAAIHKKILENPSLTDLDYHLYKFKLKNDTFYLFCNQEQVRSSLEIGEDRRELCTQAGRKLLRKIVNLYNTFTNTEEVRKHREKIQKELSFIQSLAPKYPSIASLGLKPITYLAIPSTYSLSYSTKIPKTNTKPIVASSFFPSSTPETQNPTALMKELRKILDFSLKEKSYSEDVVLQIEHLAKALPPTSDLPKAWSFANLEEKKQIQELFLETLRVYTNHNMGSNRRLFIHQLTAWNLLAAIHAISCQISPELENYGLFYASFEDLIKEPKFTNFHKYDLERYQDVLSYFRNIKKENKQLFDSTKSIEIKKDYDLLPEEILLNPIVNADPLLLQQVLELGKKLISNTKSETDPIVGKRAALLLFSQETWGEHPRIKPIASLAKAARLSQSLLECMDIQTCQNLEKLQTEPPRKYDPHTFTIKSINLENSEISDHDSIFSRRWRIPYQSEGFDSNFPTNQWPVGIFYKKNDHKFQENEVVYFENRLFRDLKKNQQKDFFPSLARLQSSTCIKSLQSQKILSYFMEHISILSEEKMQNTLLLAFFQSLIDPDTEKEIAPLHEAINNPDFLDLASEFIKKGLNAYRKNDVQTSLFFVQVARRLEELGASLNIPPLDQEINNWLLDPNLSPPIRANLHLHRILQYIPYKENLKDLELQEILVSWLFLQQLTSKSDFASWQSFHNREEVSRFLFSLTPLLEKCSTQFISSCLNQALVVKENPIHLENFPEKERIGYRYIYQDKKEKWDIDLLHGQIYHNDQPIFFTKKNPIIDSSIYEELFQEEKLLMQQEDSFFLFLDKKDHKFRAFEIEKSYLASFWEQETIAIQLQLEGDWLEYIPLTKLKNTLGHTSIPHSMIADHHVFASKARMAFMNKKTKEIEFTYTPPGILLNAEGKRVLYRKDLTFSSSLDSFEKSEWLLVAEREPKSYDVSFPRFLSTTKQPLNFIANNEGILWKDRGMPEFLVKKNPPGLLGLCNNYLFLENISKTKQKILVPVKPVEVSKKFTPHCQLDIQDQFREQEYKKATGAEFGVPQNGQHSFLEYDVIKNTVKPLNAEGALFLAYIFLAQKDYEKAINILTNDLSLKKYLEMSPLLETICNRLMELPLSSYDQSATAAAIALKSSLFMLRHQQMQSSQISKELTSNISQLWKSYFSKLDNVPQNLRLSIEDIETIEHAIKSLSSPSNQGVYFDDWGAQAMPERELAEGSNWIKYFSDHYLINDVKSFVTCYNAFIQATSEEEIAFLKMKFAKYIKRTKAKSIDVALYYASSYPKLNLPTCHATNVKELIQWITTIFRGKAEKNTLNSTNFFIPPSVHPSTSLQIAPKETASFPSISETLKAIQTPYPVEPFPLPKIVLKDLDSLIHFQNKYFIETQLDAKPISFNIHKKKIPNLYHSAIKAELASFLRDLEKGREKKEAETSFSLKKDCTITQVHRALKADLSKISEKIISLQKEIIDLIHKLPSDEKQRELTLLLRQGHVQSPIAIERIITSFLEGNSGAYSELNSHLSREELSRLDIAVGEFLRLSIKSNHMKRALSIKDPATLGQILSEDTKYRLDTYSPLVRIFLVYEYRAGIKLRKNQVELISKMLELDETGNYKNSVSQLIMGGGKTSVLAPILLHLAAKPGRIPIFIAPSAQYTTLKENLGNAQKQFFFRDLIPIQCKKEDFTKEKLTWILEQFEEAKKGRGVILSTSETLESLQLEFLSLLEGKEQEKVKILAKILVELQTRGDALIDEIDLILNPLRETNFPTGVKQLVDPNLVKLAKHLFSLMIKPDLAGNLRLQENKQSSLEQKDYQIILKEVASKFLETYPDLKIPSQHKKAALEYILDSEHLEKMFQTLPFNSSQKERLALAKHLISSVLPLTLSKSSGQHYGRMAENSKVIPYLGVDTPSSTEIGEPWEAVSYHFQTVLSKGVEISQIRDFGEALLGAAFQYAMLHGIDITQTPENKIFQEITGITLLELKDQKKLQKAVKSINQNPETQLSLEAETISQIAGSYLSYVRSNAQSFIEQLATKRGFSGTPGNGVLNPKSLQEHMYLDAGTEGRIVYEFLERAQNYPDSIHTISSSEAQTTLQTILEKMSDARKKRLHGFIDSAGFFKETPNELVAKSILKYYAKDDRIQTVLYFDRPPGNSKGAAVLMAKQKGDEDRSIVIGSTQKTEIAKYGIKPESTFTYYDEYHCEATDVPQTPDAINAISIGHRTTLRTFSQGMLRNRGYLAQGDLEYVIKQEETHHFSGSKDAPSHEDILLQTIHNQAIRLADLSFRTYKQKVDNALRQIAIELILQSKDVKRQQALMKQFQEVLIVRNSQSLPWESAKMQNTAQVMRNYRKKQETLFQKLTSDENLKNLAKKRLDEISRSSYLPSQVKNLQETPLESQIELFLQQETQQELTQELEQELAQELESYQQSRHGTSFEEILWEEKHLQECCKAVPYKDYDLFLYEGFKTALDYFKAKSVPPHVHSLKNLLKPNKNFKFKYLQDYFKIFSDNLQISHNFAHTLIKLEPVFSRNQKHAEQILVTKENGTLKATMISSLEAKSFKKHIETKQPSDMWLFLPDGHSYVKNPPAMSSKDSEDLKRLLWEVNLFNGNVEALLKDENTPIMLEFLDAELISRFLRLKVEYQPIQKAMFLRNKELFSQKNENSSYQEPLHVKIRKMSKEDLKTLPPHLFQYLSRKQVQEIDSSHLDKLIDMQIPFLNPHQFKKLKKPSHIRKIPLEHIDKISSSQHEHLSKRQKAALKTHQKKDNILDRLSEALPFFR